MDQANNRGADATPTATNTAGAGPEGWKLVPVEPTQGMLDEITLLKEFTPAAMRARYAAMLDAAPAISHSGEGAPDDVELTQVVSFLMGESELEGVEFGERHPTKAGAFWWRLNLRAAMHKAVGAHQK